jgi:hypothetical protein
MAESSKFKAQSESPSFPLHKKGTMGDLTPFSETRHETGDKNESNRDQKIKQKL